MGKGGYILYRMNLSPNTSEVRNYYEFDTNMIRIPEWLMRVKKERINDEIYN
jgi:hypothetical protein